MRTIDAHCRSRMAAFKRPRQLVVVDQLPRTATGKIRRFALREQLVGDALIDGLDVDVTPAAPGAEDLPAARVPARGSRLDRAVALVPRRRPRRDRLAGDGRVLAARLRVERAGHRAARRDVHARRGRRRAAGAAGGARHRAAGARRPQRRGLDRPAPRRRRARRRTRSCCSPRTCSSRTARSPAIAAAREAYATTDLPATHGPPPPRRRRHVPRVERHLAGARVPVVEHRGPPRARSPRPVLLIQGADDQYGTLAQLDAIERGVAGPVERLVLPGVGHAPHLEAPDVTVAAVAAFINGF